VCVFVSVCVCVYMCVFMCNAKMCLLIKKPENCCLNKYANFLFEGYVFPAFTPETRSFENICLGTVFIKNYTQFIYLVFFLAEKYWENCRKIINGKYGVHFLKDSCLFYCHEFAPLFNSVHPRPYKLCV